MIFFFFFRALCKKRNCYLQQELDWIDLFNFSKQNRIRHFSTRSPSDVTEMICSRYANHQPVFRLTREALHQRLETRDLLNSELKTRQRTNTHVETHDESLCLQVPGGRSLRLTGSRRGTGVTSASPSMTRSGPSSGSW